MTIKILDNLIIGDTEWQISPFKFNVSQLNFVSGGDAPSSGSRLITSDNKYFKTKDNEYFLVEE